MLVTPSQISSYYLVFSTRSKLPLAPSRTRRSDINYRRFSDASWDCARMTIRQLLTTTLFMIGCACRFTTSHRRFRSRGNVFTGENTKPAQETGGCQDSQ
jgi:hypothetical protein